MKKLGVFLLLTLFVLGACGRSEIEKENKKKKEKITQVKKIEKAQEQITEEADTTIEISDKDFDYPDSLY
jgi:hypothetical protein